MDPEIRERLRRRGLPQTPMYEQAGNFIALPVKVLYLGRLLWAHKVILVQRLHPFFHLCSEIKISIIFRSVSNKRSSSIGSFSSNSHIFETSKTFIDTKLKFQKSTIFTSLFTVPEPTYYARIFAILFSFPATFEAFAEIPNPAIVLLVLSLAYPSKGKSKLQLRILESSIMATF